jgi:hypothetical protein
MWAIKYPLKPKTEMKNHPCLFFYKAFVKPITKASFAYFSSRRKEGFFEKKSRGLEKGRRL